MVTQKTFFCRRFWFLKQICHGVRPFRSGRLHICVTAHLWVVVCNVELSRLVHPCIHPFNMFERKFRITCWGKFLWFSEMASTERSLGGSSVMSGTLSAASRLTGQREFSIEAQRISMSAYKLFSSRICSIGSWILQNGKSIVVFLWTMRHTIWFRILMVRACRECSCEQWTRRIAHMRQVSEIHMWHSEWLLQTPVTVWTSEIMNRWIIQKQGGLEPVLICGNICSLASSSSCPSRYKESNGW